MQPLIQFLHWAGRKRLPIVAVLAALCLSGVSARGAFIDLSGQIIKPGGSISGTSSTPVPAALLYDIGFTGSGTATGSFAFVTNTNSLSAMLNTMGVLSVPTLANISGKIPVTFCAKYLENFLSNVAITSSTTASQLEIKTYVSFSVDKKGFVHAKASKFSFVPENNEGRRIRVPFTGTYTIASGAGITFVPSVPISSSTGQASIIFPIGRLAIPDGTELSMVRGTSKTTFIILKNDGPATDNLNLIGFTPTFGYKMKVYDGRTDITDQVYTSGVGGLTTGTGYPVPNVPSGGTKLIKAVVTATSKVSRFSSGDMSFILQSADAPGNDGSGDISVFIR